MLKISIVTPSFNQGRFIGKCLESVCSQRGNFRIEHIILDNCSTDETVQALAHYQVNHGDVDVHILVEPDGGQTAAINKGFGLATGDIICWLNTDEWYEPDALSNVADFFHHHPEADVVFGGCNFVDTRGKVRKQKKEIFFSQAMLVYYGCFLPSCATFIRRKIIDRGIFLNTSYKVSMDHEWYCNIAYNGFKFSPINKLIANFTWHETNISKQTPYARRQIERNMTRFMYGDFSFLPNLMRILLFDILNWLWVFIRIFKKKFSLMK